MLKNLFFRMEHTSISLAGGATAFLAIVLIRTFFENITYRTTSSFFSSNVQTWVHFSLFYFVALLGLILILHFFARVTIQNVTHFAFLCFPIILTPPLIDFLLFRGASGNQVAYIFTDAHGLLINFFSFYQFQELPGMSTGIRIEIAVILVSSFVYIYTQSRSVLRGIVGALSAHILLFSLFTLPSFIALGHTSPAWFINVSQKLSLLPLNFFNPNFFEASVTHSYLGLFDTTLTLVEYLIALPLIALYAWIHSRHVVIAFLKNARLERIAHYSFLIGAGLVLGAFSNTVPLRLNWISYGTILCLFLSFWFAWLYAVGCNDCVDVETDALSNPHRPLITGALSFSEIKMGNAIFLVLALIGGYIAGNIAFFMLLLFTALYHVYSMPPLKLKRFLGINSFIIGLCALTAFSAGYFTLSTSKEVDSMPLAWLLLVVLSYTLVANIKDIKDIAGDHIAQIYTIPVVWGDVLGKKIISGLIVVALLLPPYLLSLPVLYFLVPPFGFFATLLIHRKPFMERYVFFAYFGYLSASVLLLTFL